ncbi:MAG: ABC transporter ATP-binding protein [Myxococcales bacterium]
MTMLIVSDLHAGYGLSEVLVGTSLEVKAGSVVALIGANGAGKTTTMRAVSGLLRPTKGRVLLEGKPVQDLPASRIARLGLAHSPEGRKVFGPLSVEDNLLLGAFRRLPRFFGFHREASADLDRVYQLFPRLRERRKQDAGTLSGGEQQMLAIGRALLTNPKLLVMDEPSEGLAPTIVEQLTETCRTLVAEGVTLLLVEQNLGMAAAVADRLLVMVHGQVALETTSAQLLADEEAQRRYLGVEPTAA